MGTILKATIRERVWNKDSEQYEEKIIKLKRDEDN